MSNKLPSKKNPSEIASFLGKAKAIRSVVERQPRLLFALDATASREPTWDRARKLHSELFDAAADGTRLAIQLCYYRGLTEFQASSWLTTSTELRAHMNSVECIGGPTQIARLIRHYLKVGTPSTPVRALVFVGDAIEETPATLLELAGQCRLRNQPLFLFQDGNDSQVASVFQQMAKVSGGVYAALDHRSGDRLRELLGAVVRYASGGRKALSHSGRESDKLLLAQLPK